MTDTNDASAPAAPATDPAPAAEGVDIGEGNNNPPAAAGPSKSSSDAGPNPSDADAPGAEAEADQPQKKRRQERQMRREDLDDEHECDDEDDDAKEARLVPGSFARASEEQMKKRRILKVKRTGGGDGGAAAAPAPAAAAAAASVAPNEAGEEATKRPEETADAPAADGTPQKDEPEAAAAPAPAPATKSNPFAAVSLVAGEKKDDYKKEEEASTPAPAPAPAAFGSAAGFKGFATAGGTSGGFGSSAGGGSTFGSGTGFSGFGTKVASTGFGSGGGTSTGFGASGSGGFGEETKNDGAKSKSPSVANGNTSPEAAAAAASSAASPVPPAVVLGDKIDHVETGEEGEDLLLEVRAKLFKWGAVATAKSEGQDGAAGVGAEHSVAPTSNAFGGEEKKAGEDDDDDSGGDKPAKMDWKEQGVGLLRLLRGEVDGGHSYRLVQRQEDEKKEGGKVTGIRVILNLRLPEGVCTVFRKADKYVKLSVFEKNEGGDGKPQMADFLFKVKTSDMADKLQKTLVEAAGVKLME